MIVRSVKDLAILKEETVLYRISLDQSGAKWMAKVVEDRQMVKVVMNNASLYDANVIITDFDEANVIVNRLNSLFKYMRFNYNYNG